MKSCRKWFLLAAAVLLAAALPGSAQDCDGCIYGSLRLTYNAQAQTVTAIASTLMDYTASDYYEGEAWLELDDYGSGGQGTYDQTSYGWSEFGDASTSLEVDQPPSNDEFEANASYDGILDPIYSGYNFFSSCSPMCACWYGCFWQGWAGNGSCCSGFIGGKGSCSMYLPDSIDGGSDYDTVETGSPFICSGAQDAASSVLDLNNLYAEYSSSATPPVPDCSAFYSSNFNPMPYSAGLAFSPATPDNITEWALFTSTLQIAVSDLENSYPAGVPDPDASNLPSSRPIGTDPSGGGLYRTPQHQASFSSHTNDQHIHGNAIDMIPASATLDGWTALADWIAWGTSGIACIEPHGNQTNDAGGEFGHVHADFRIPCPSQDWIRASPSNWP